MHEMVIGHEQERGFIPRRDLGSASRDALLPSAALTPNVIRLDAVMELREVRRVDGPGTGGGAARDGLMLQRADEIFVGGVRSLGHGRVLYRRDRGETSACVGRISAVSPPRGTRCRLTPGGRGGYPPSTSTSLIVRMAQPQSNQKGDGYYG